MSDEKREAERKKAMAEKQAEKARLREQNKAVTGVTAASNVPPPAIHAPPINSREKENSTGQVMPEIKIQRGRDYEVAVRAHKNKSITGAAIGSLLRKGYTPREAQAYDLDLQTALGKAQQEGISLSATKFNITTKDEQTIEALELKKDPPTAQTIIMFQAQKGNFQNLNQLELATKLAEKYNANVVLFNYREVPDSKNALINDGLAVCEYLFRHQSNKSSTRIPKPEPENVRLMGHSLGGLVASEVAAKLSTQPLIDGKKIDLKLTPIQAPRTLAAATKFIDLNDLTNLEEVKKELTLRKGLITILGNIKKALPEAMYKIIYKAFNWDLDAQSAINKLKPENVTCVRDEQDKIIPPEAGIKHENQIVCSTQGEDVHNIPINELTVKGTNQDALSALVDYAPANTQSSEDRQSRNL